MTHVPDRYYFVCDCGAKAFAVAALITCPRCGRQLVSTEHMVLPWQKKPNQVPQRLSSRFSNGSVQTPFPTEHGANVVNNE